MKIKIFLGLFFTIIIATSCMQAMQSIHLPFNKKFGLENVNYGIKNGIRISTAAFLGYNMIVKSIINIGKLMFDYPVNDPYLGNLDTPSNQSDATLYYIGNAVLGGFVAHFLLRGDFQEYPVAFLFCSRILFGQLPGGGSVLCDWDMSDLA